ncbi:hypothetical protein [Leisingera sp. S232]|uniref:hypothetical protein n=1 Tax=Leisingera sp. S232 TaxID=3415132 RepID=UPI00086EA688|nr:hypothetical protein AB838_21760 [Rhodobacteraceae bacterium (ex Bugula neritina AB1)]
MKLIKKLIQPSGSGSKAPSAAAKAPVRLRTAEGAPAPLKVVLFIGHHKVGSTSLQDFLARNAPALARHGILYPFVEFEGLSHMAAAAGGLLPPPEDSLPINLREPHNALAFRMLADHKRGKVPSYHKRLPALPQMVHAIQQQIRFSEPHTVVLAAEVFANFSAAGPELIERLAGWFPGAEFTLVATLRRIDEYLASWHGQRLKFGHKLAPLRKDGLESYLRGIHFNYRLMVEGWVTALPEARVVLRDYEQVRASGGSVADFITQAGLDLPSGLAPERRENDSIHRAFYEIARQANHRLAPELAAELRKALRTDLQGRLPLPASSSIELFGADNRARMLEQFRPIDAWLGETVGRSTFFADLEQVLERKPLPEPEAMQLALAQLQLQELDREGKETLSRFLTELAVPQT